MPSNNSKYTTEMREQTVAYIIENHNSATSMAEKMGIDTNTVCRWVRDYRRKYKLPSYAEEKGRVRKPPQSAPELKYRVKELEALKRGILNLCSGNGDWPRRKRRSKS